MKYLKLFESFINNNSIVDTLHKIKETLPTNVEFSWTLESRSDEQQMQGFLNISLYENDLELDLQWAIDLDNPEIQFIPESEDEDLSYKSYRQKVNNIDEALELVKIDIKECLNQEITNERVELFLEKNVAKNQSLWASCKAWAKERYDVWPSAYACGAAAKRYKAKGGKWRKAKKRKSKRRSRKNRR